MARVFVSWGTPDKEVVAKLVACFRSAGIDLFEYTRDMHAGDQIHQRVLDEIHLAEIAILCLSDQSSARDWVQREIDWCFSDLKNPHMPLKRLISVEVGELTDANVLPLLKESGLHRFSIYKSADPDRGLGELLNDVLTALGGPAPLFVPAMTFAMTRTQAREALLEQSSWNSLRSLGLHVGMVWQDGVPPWLPHRYGEISSDFRPFFQDKSLTEIVQETVDWINKNTLWEYPINVKWYDPIFLLDDMRLHGHYWDHFNSNKHIIVIDSISMLHGSVRSCLMETFSALSGGVDWRALTWIPPYTQHTLNVEKLIFEATKSVVPLISEFYRWRDQPGCSSSFDASTKIGFQHWLHGAIAHVTRDAQPRQENLQEIIGQYRGPRTAPFRSR